MRNLERAVSELLACERIAVVGVARDGQSPANLIYRKLKESGRRVFAVNPNADEVGGERCYGNVAAIPGGVDAAVVVTRPEVSASVVDECAAAGARWIWLHRSFGKGSVSEEAIERCRIHGIHVIPGGCPMMHCAPVDPGHACMRVMLRLFGGLPVPSQVPAAAAGPRRGRRAGEAVPFP
jgi:predicted CoA-binding protein